MYLDCAPIHSGGQAPPTSAAFFGLPFDAIRLHYAACVQAGLIRRSMLESRDFEKALIALERLTLGPLARRN
jgi:hypothetical protein